MVNLASFVIFHSCSGIRFGGFKCKLCVLSDITVGNSQSASDSLTKVLTGKMYPVPGKANENATVTAISSKEYPPNCTL